MPDHRRGLAGPDGTDRLPCGTAIDGLFAQVTGDRPPRDHGHQRTCPHCRAALAELQDLWTPVRELAAENLTAPASLLAAVMARVRELSRNTWYAVLPGPRGETKVAARVVGVIARLAAERVPEVLLALGRGDLASAAPGAEQSAAAVKGAGAEVGIAGARVVVDVRIVLEYRVSIATVAAQIQRQIAQDLHDLAGVAPIEVNVAVVDVEAPH